MRTELAALEAALPKQAWLDIADRGKNGAIKLTDLDAAPEPRNPRRLKAEVRTRWGIVPLIDMLKEAVLRTGCLTAVTATAGRGDLAPDVLAQRLLLAIYDYGINTGTRAIAGNAQHGHGEDDIRYVRRRYLTAEHLGVRRRRCGRTALRAGRPGGVLFGRVLSGWSAESRRAPSPVAVR